MFWALELLQHVFMWRKMPPQRSIPNYCLLLQMRKFLSWKITQHWNILLPNSIHKKGSIIINFPKIIIDHFPCTCRWNFIPLLSPTGAFIVTVIYYIYILYIDPPATFWHFSISANIFIFFFLRIECRLMIIDPGHFFSHFLSFSLHFSIFSLSPLSSLCFLLSERTSGVSPVTFKVKLGLDVGV